jgi:hypothetical protein
MNIDEAGSDDLPGRINLSSSRLRYTGINSNDPALLDRHVASKARGATPVDNPAVLK